MLSKPIYALTKDRSKKALVNNICGDPEEWFDFQTFKENNLFAASFDFFVDWKNKKICDEVWIKRISDSDNIQNLDEEELIKLISDCDGVEKSRRLYLFLRNQKIKEKYMLFKDVPEESWKNGTGIVVELDLSKYKKGSISRFNINEIQDKIKKLRKVPAPIGRSGLNYSTSSLEGYLSKQQFFWPGDVDMVLYDGNNNAVAIIEFKKHTARSEITFEDQKISNYLNKDILKYKSLALLRNHFKTDLFVLYYPVPADINYIIIEKIEGAPDSLHAAGRYELDLPVKNDINKMRTFADRFISEVLKR